MSLLDRGRGLLVERIHESSRTEGEKHGAVIDATARGAGRGAKRGGNAIKICVKGNPKWTIFGPKVGSEGATVLGVSFWRFGVPFGILFGSFSGSVFGVLFGGRLGGALGTSASGSFGSGEDQGRMRGG